MLRAMLLDDGAVQNLERLAFDKASARSFDAFGRMHVENCRISKANVCPYYGREIPNAQALGLDSNKVYNLYRDPGALEKAASAFSNSPLLMMHEGVTAADPKKHLTVGTVGNVTFDGTYLVSDKLSVWTQDGIKLIESKQAAELSPCYKYRAIMTPGVSPEGVAFDGVMVDIHPNHVALVREGRTGHDVYVNDERPPELPAMIVLKRPNLLAQMVAAGLATATNDAERLALDAKLADCTAKDAEPDEDEAAAKKRKGKLNPGKGEPGEAGGAMASDEQIEAAIVAKGYITQAEAKVLAEDASVSAVKKVNALHTAREAVKPLVGVVAMDSAEQVYEFALKQAKVNIDGVHASAYPALVAQAVAAKAAPAPTTALAKDGKAIDINSAVPALGRFAQG